MPLALYLLGERTNEQCPSIIYAIMRIFWRLYAKLTRESCRLFVFMIYWPRRRNHTSFALVKGEITRASQHASRWSARVSRRPLLLGRCLPSVLLTAFSPLFSMPCVNDGARVTPKSVRYSSGLIREHQTSEAQARFGVDTRGVSAPEERLRLWPPIRRYGVASADGNSFSPSANKSFMRAGA